MGGGGGAANTGFRFSRSVAVTVTVADTAHRCCVLSQGYTCGGLVLFQPQTCEAGALVTTVSQTRKLRQEVMA